LFKLGKIAIGKFKLLPSPDFALSLEPILSTAALMIILFLWLRKICSPGISLSLTLAGAFGTMLWPYTYIGLETKQSLFVFLAGYLALANGEITGWRRTLSFAVACGIAVSLKSTGPILCPAIGYLIYVQFRNSRSNRMPKIETILLVIAACWLTGMFTRQLYWDPRGGNFNNINGWWIESPIQLMTNAIGIFGSPTKGIFVFAPILIASIFAIPQALRKQRDATIFALLIVSSIIGFYSLFIHPADEVWGSRYMHIVIAPLLVCVGAAWPKFEWRRHVPILVLAGAGVVVSFLGSLFYYGARLSAMEEARQHTMEWITGDTAWNEAVFSARLFQIWRKGITNPLRWTPKHIWVWDPPANNPGWESVDLEKQARPQSILLKVKKDRLRDERKFPRGIFICSLIIGILLQVWVIFRTTVNR
jgi:hypothetical protein